MIPSQAQTTPAHGIMARPHVALRDVGLLRGGRPVLQSLSLSVPLDRRVVILGPNGAGKSLLLHLVQGLIAPDLGSLTMHLPSGDKPAGRSEPGRSEPSARLAFVFQRPVMLRRSAQGNIEHALALAGVPARQRQERALAALRRVGLEDAAQRPARRMSGGEQQRLALARAHALAPVALLLDEPTASLDPGAAAGIERELLRIAEEGTGLLMATHDLAMARRLATDIVFLHRGKVLAQGAARQCLDEPADPILRRFLAGQWLE